MHAVVVRVTINDFEPAVAALREQVIPRVTQVPGFVAGYWLAPDGQNYEVNVQLRQGERLTRNWFNKGLHVNQQEGGSAGCLTSAPGKDDLRYAPQYGDLAPGRIGNGTLVYDVPLASGDFRAEALTAENLASRSDDRRAPALHLRQPDHQRHAEHVAGMDMGQIHRPALRIREDPVDIR